MHSKGKRMDRTQIHLLATSNRTASQRSLLSERINKLVQALSDGVYEREGTIKLCLLAAL